MTVKFDRLKRLEELQETLGVSLIETFIGISSTKDPEGLLELLNKIIPSGSLGVEDYKQLQELLPELDEIMDYGLGLDSFKIACLVRDGDFSSFELSCLILGIQVYLNETLMEMVK